MTVSENEDELTNEIKKVVASFLHVQSQLYLLGLLTGLRDNVST